MSKNLLDKQLVYLDFVKNEFKFYNIEVLSIGFNEVQIIFTYGVLGNKGRNSVEIFTDKNASKKDKSTVLKQAMKKAYKKIYEKKAEGYISLQKMEEGLKHAIKLDNIVELEKNNKKNFKKSSTKKTDCDQCGKHIDEKNYARIDSWGRGPGNWDSDETKFYFKKVICLDCQIDKNIFQRQF